MGAALPRCLAIYYTPEHIETILRRAQACGINIRALLQIMLLVRARSRSRRCIRWRAASAAEDPPSAGPDCRSSRRGVLSGLAGEFLVKHGRVASFAWRIFRIYRRVAESSDEPYTDQAMTPVTEDETDNLELFTHNESAREAVDHARKVKTLTSAADGPAAVIPSGQR